jgi:hypothetical protein
MKIRPVEAEFNAGGWAAGGGRTGMIKLIVPFRNFAKAPKNTHVQFDKNVISLQYKKQSVIPNNMVAKTLENYIQYFLHLVLYSLCAFLGIVFVLRVLLSYVYLL